MAKLNTGRHTSAQKAHRQSERRMYRNRLLKKTAREATKGVLAAVDSKDEGKAGTSLVEASSLWDRAAKHRAIHWKTAARRKSRLAARVKKLSAK